MLSHFFLHFLRSAGSLAIDILTGHCWQLLPLMVLLFIANFRIALITRQAWIAVVLRQDSWLFRWVKGRVYATCTSIVFAVAATFFVLWEAVSLSPWELVLLAFLFLTAAFLSAFLRRFCATHLTDPFDRRTAIRLTTIIAGFLFLLLFWRLAYAADVHGGALLDAHFLDALQLGLDALPERRGPVAELLAFPYAFEAAKLWAVARLSSYDWLRWITFLFGLDEAVFSFVLARAAAVLGDLLGSSGTGSGDTVKDQKTEDSRREESDA